MKSKDPQTITVHVREEHAGQRLDKWLSGQENVPSRSRAAQLIAQGLVTLNGKPLKASFKVPAHSAIVIRIPEAPPGMLQPLNRPLDILYQDDDVVVVNKPAGLVVHPAAGHAQDTLVNILLHHVDKLSMGFNEQRPGIVHRLDRDTSGIMVVAKNDAAHRSLAEQFKNKTTHRIYWAIVHGTPSTQKGTFRSWLARHPQDRKRFSSQASGKSAVTHFQVLRSHGMSARRVNHQTGFSWIQCKLETGRTHQIRVHLSESGHPIVGDVIYGRKSRAPADVELGRLALHACELGFKHPRTGEEMFFQVPWPEPLASFAEDKGFTPGRKEP